MSSNNIQRGDIILIEFPFSDLSGSKKRPALVLAVHGPDVLVAFITSNTNYPELTDIVLRPDAANGLRVPSLLKVHKLATLSQRLASGKIGAVSALILTRTVGNLATILSIPLTR